MRQCLFILLFLAVEKLYSQSESEFVNTQIDSFKTTIKTKLKLPLGTVAKLTIEIFDGDKLQIKEKQGVYLFRVLSINDIKQTDTLLMTFEDETHSFAKNDVELCNLLYKKEIRNLSQREINKMKEKYVDKKFAIMAYETGEFSGMLEGYLKYQPVRADLNFHFRNYLIVLSNLTK